LGELWEALCKEWDGIPAALFDFIIQSMPRRVSDVIACKGASTKDWLLGSEGGVTGSGG